MNDEIKRIDPKGFEELFGEDAALAIIVKKDYGQRYMIPEGAGVEMNLSPGAIQSMQSGYYKCVNGVLYYCWNDSMCFEVGTC